MLCCLFQRNISFADELDAILILTSHKTVRTVSLSTKFKIYLSESLV